MTGSLGEFGRIERFFQPLAANFPGAFALTDDAASIAVPPGRELIVTTDAIVAGVHFLPEDAPSDIARKALRVNLSDLAAKGASALAYTLTLALPRDTADSWVEAFAAGLAEDQSTYCVSLIGGDSVSTAGPVWVSIAAFGLVDSGRMVRRSGARPGDLVFVTGSIGDATLGLAVLQSEIAVAEADGATLSARYRLPNPRTALAAAIAAHASSAIDVSDGLAADFGHICVASGVTGIIDASRIPLSPAVRRATEARPDLWERVLTGGDDYEILLTAPSENAAPFRDIAENTGIPVTQIGHIESGEGRAILIEGGKPLALKKPGWTHG